jgi:putative phage-type endonuclease
MTVKEFQITETNKQDWLENRLLDVTSTEVSCLFNLNPYKTVLDLYYEKKEKLIQNIDSPRMAWGRRLEKSIAEGFAEEKGVEVKPYDVYLSNIETRMGSSFDYKILGEQEALLEIKNVDRYVWHDKWDEDSEGNILAPPFIEMQLQHQLHLANIESGYIVALVGGNEMKICKRERFHEVGEQLEAKVKEFWERVKTGTPPDIDYERDSNYLIKNLYNQAEAGITLAADEDVDTLIDDYNSVNREYVSLGKQKESIKAQILEKSQNASKIISKYGTINCGMTKGSQGKYITQEMVGTYINSRRSFRQFKFNQPKGV